MRKYDEYKESGVKTLGDIPSDWKVKKVKNITANVGDGLHGTPKYDDKGDYFFINGNNLIDKKIVLNDARNISYLEYLRIKKEVSPRTLFLSINGTIGNVARYNGEKIALGKSVAYLNLFKNGIDRNYFLYEFMSTTIQNSFEVELTGTTIKNLSLKTIRNTFVILPPLQEQTQIANYLDQKTQTIDKKIKLLQQKIDYYKEYKKALINETVCRGLDKNVKLKDSGIEWIGGIPEHWEVKRFKSFAKTIKGKNLEQFEKKKNGYLPLLSLEYLRRKTGNPQYYCYTNDEKYIASENDLIIIWDGAGVGEILKAKKGYISSTIAKIKFDSIFYDKYFYFLKNNLEYMLKRIPAGMGIPHLNPQVLNNYSCTFPPRQEQIQIANFLDKKTSNINKITTNIEQQKIKLTELRKTLINDVVTGKIKVID